MLAIYSQYSKSKLLFLPLECISYTVYRWRIKNIENTKSKTFYTGIFKEALLSGFQINLEGATACSQSIFRHLRVSIQGATKLWNAVPTVIINARENLGLGAHLGEPPPQFTAELHDYRTIIWGASDRTSPADTWQPIIIPPKKRHFDWRGELTGRLQGHHSPERHGSLLAGDTDD